MEKQPKKKPIKFYWTKKRKKELRKWQVLGASFILAVSVLGGLGEYTKKYIGNFKLAEIAYAKEAPIAENSREPIEDMIRRLAKEINFEWTDYLVRLAICESNLRPDATGTTGNKPSKSRDRGLFQINSYHHYEVTDEQAYDAEWSTKWTMDRINKGYQSEWTCDRKI